MQIYAEAKSKTSKMETSLLGLPIRLFCRGDTVYVAKPNCAEAESNASESKYFAKPIKSHTFASAYLQGRVKFPTGGKVREPKSAAGFAFTANRA